MFPSTGGADLSRVQSVNGMPGTGKPRSGGANSSSPETQAPNPFCSYLGRNPWKTFGLAMGGHLVAVLVTAILVGVHYMEYTKEFSFDVRGANEVEKGNAWLAMQADGRNDFLSTVFPDQGTRTVEAMPLQLIYEGNCLTAANLASIRTLENSLAALSGYQNSICQLESNGGSGTQCRPARSILRFFDGSYEGYNVVKSGLNVFRPDPGFSRIAEIISVAESANGNSADSDVVAAGNPNLKIFLEYALGDYSASSGTAGRCRTQVYSGLPLSGYRNVYDRREAQESELGDRHVAVLRDFLGDRNEVGTMDMYFSSAGLADEAEQSERREGFLLMLASLGFALLYLALRTQSAWVTLLTLFGWFSSLLWAHLAYNLVCRVQYFGLTQAYGVYVLGLVGAVGSFAIIHTFSRANLQDIMTEALPTSGGAAAVFAAEQRRANQLSLCWRRAHMVVLPTFLAALLAFVAQCTSQILMVVALGLFYALIVFVLYFNTMIFMPAVLVTWQFSVRQRMPWFKRDRERGKDPALTRLCERGYFDRLVVHPCWRWLVIATSVVVLMVFLVASIQRLNFRREQPNQWREDTNYGEFYELSQDGFSASDQDYNARVFVVFGLADHDLSECSRFEFDCLGSPVYDLLFDLSSGTAQNKAKALCDKLKSLSTTDAFNLRIRHQSTFDSATKTNPLEVRCFIEGQEDFYGSLPFTADDMQTVVEDHPGAYPADVYRSMSFIAPTSDNTYFRHYELGLQNFLSNNGSTDFPSEYFTLYSQYFNGRADDTATRNATQLSYAGAFGNYLRFAAFEVNLTLVATDLDGAEALGVMANWDAFLATEAASMPYGMRSIFQATPLRRAWAWARAQEELTKTIFVGLSVGLLFGAAVILLATNNWILAVTSALAAAATMVCVFGSLAFAGYDLGFHEALIFVAPMAVAWTLIVPIVVTYAESTALSAPERTRETMRTVGPTVFDGKESRGGGQSRDA